MAFVIAIPLVIITIAVIKIVLVIKEKKKKKLNLELERERLTPGPKTSIGGANHASINLKRDGDDLESHESTM